ncbi:MAG: T9SS type A sorting domain-containing protein [bacterium]|nr:T9SS type A sorting domain-containing protein [bacterium]
MSTRILSVFNLLKRVGFAVLLLIASFSAYTQPQAPIEWGGTELLQTCPLNYARTYMGYSGDSLAVFGAYDDGAGHIYPSASISIDDGQSWSPWHNFVYPPPTTNDDFAWAAFTSTAITVCTQAQYDQYGYYRTLDQGVTWQNPTSTRNRLFQLDRRGDTLVSREDHLGVSWTPDNGSSFSPVWSIDLGNWNTGFRDLSMSATHLHAIIVDIDSMGLESGLYYTRSPQLHGPFEPLRRLNPDLFFAQDSEIEFDDEGTGVILSSVIFGPPGFAPASLAMNTSRDEGETWSAFDTVRMERTVGWSMLEIEHERSKWIAIWGDGTIEDGFSYGGWWYRFSANRCRSWYPIHQIWGDDPPSDGLGGVELRGNRVRVYSEHDWYNGVPGPYYVRWEGLIQEDSLPPTILDASQLPLSVPSDTTLTLEIEATDNDSLWLTQVVALRTGSTDTLFLPLEHTSDNVYQATWVVTDTALWNYYYHVEDMWENVSFTPSNGPTQPWTIQVGPDLDATEQPAVPDVLHLSVFPNPVNGILSIRGTRINPSMLQSLTVFDILGRKVAHLQIPAGTGSEFHVSWNLISDNGRPIPTGTYIISYSAATHITRSKVTVVR